MRSNTQLLLTLIKACNFLFLTVKLTTKVVLNSKFIFLVEGSTRAHLTKNVFSFKFSASMVQVIAKSKDNKVVKEINFICCVLVPLFLSVHTHTHTQR